MAVRILRARRDPFDRDQDARRSAMKCWHAMRANLALTLLLLPGLAAGAPRLQRLQIDLWPEYDRPAVLVILKGEIAGNADAATPLSLRIPASSGGPSAIAYSAQESGPLLNLPHDRSPAADFITLRFAVPSRFFHVEFYDPLDTRGEARSYRYQWPGDLPVETLRVTLQEPAASSGLTVQPALAQWTVGTDNLRYRSTEFSPVPLGKALPFEIAYAKSDPRNTLEILKTGSSSADTGVGTTREERTSFRLFLASSAVALLLAGATLFYYVRRRPRVAPATGTDSGGCSKCGHRPSAGDRYCARCGAPL